MKQLIFSLLPFFLIPTLLSCNLEVDTADPQASSEIKESKKNGFFNAEFSCYPDSGNSIQVSEAWTEAVWFNTFYISVYKLNKDSIWDRLPGFRLKIKKINKI